MKKERAQYPCNPTIERRAKALEVWNQIRRTEEVPMEMGTIEYALPQEHSVGAEGAGSMETGLSRIVA